jgi:ABC-type sugar transport system permease subunit
LKEAKLTLKFSNKITSKELDIFLTICIKISDQLAADRATAFLPIMAAQGFFIGALAIALFKTASITPGSGNYISVEIHSIAFSALYFWIIPAVFISAVIGVSQTAKSIPNFLETLQSEFKHHDFLRDIQLPNIHCIDEDQMRILNGGVYSWQPKAKKPKLFRAVVLESFIAILSITFSIITACLFSGYVPADGWQPRHCAYMFYLLMWVLSFVLTGLLKRSHSSNSVGDMEYQRLTTNKHPLQANIVRFRLTYLKDIVWTLGTIGPLMYIQAGPFNNCESYSAWGRAGLALPEIQNVADLLKERIHGLYIGIAILGIGVQVCITAGSLWGCRKALRVLLQNDDGTSLRPVWLRWSKPGRLQRQSRSERSLSTSSYMLRNFTGRG